jgi:hypothetical protein
MKKIDMLCQISYKNELRTERDTPIYGHPKVFKKRKEGWGA